MRLHARNPAPNALPSCATRVKESKPSQPTPASAPVRSLVDALPDLKVISSLGVGLDVIDLPRMRERGIAVGYTPEVLNDCVADLAFALLTNIARSSWWPTHLFAAAPGCTGGFPMATRISGKRLGILGMGRIGRVIAKRAAGFDMDVRYHNRKPVEGSPLGYAASAVELVQWCDFLVVTSAGGASTRSPASGAVLRCTRSSGLSHQCFAWLGGRSRCFD